MIQRFVLAIVPLAAAAALPGASPAAAGPAHPPLGVYRCAAEEVVVAHCDISCDVHYPDRPKPRGFTIQKSVSIEETAAQVRACRLVELFDADGVARAGSGGGGPAVAAAAPRRTTPQPLDCYDRLAREPALAPLAGKVDLGHAVTEPSPKFEIAARATPAEGQLLLRWAAARQACAVQTAPARAGWSEAARRIDALGAQATDEGIRLLAAGKISYGRFNTVRARNTLAVQRRSAELSGGGQAVAAAGQPGKAQVRRPPPGGCPPGDFDCAYAADPTNPGRIMNKPYVKPYVEPYVQPYAPPPVPGPSLLATAGYGAPN